MASVKQFLIDLKARALAALQEAWATEPTMIQASVFSALVAIAAALNVSIKSGALELAVSILLPLVFGALLRKKVTPVGAARAVRHARVGSKRHVIGAFLFHRTALAARKRIERMQDAARAEESLPEDTEPARAALRLRYGGDVTATSKLTIAKATHKERGRWVILAG